MLGVVASQMSAARFPAYRNLYGFNFAESEVDERLVQDLHRCEFIQSSQNLVFVGGPGTGKTHLATAIGVQAIQHHGLRVRLISTLELVNALELEKRKDQCGRNSNKMRSLSFFRRLQLAFKFLAFSATLCRGVVHQSQVPTFVNREHGVFEGNATDAINLKLSQAGRRFHAERLQLHHDQPEKDQADTGEAGQ